MSRSHLAEDLPGGLEPISVRPENLASFPLPADRLSVGFLMDIGIPPTGPAIDPTFRSSFGKQLVRNP